jgi:hypothetical protein
MIKIQVWRSIALVRADEAPADSRDFQLEGQEAASTPPIDSLCVSLNRSIRFILWRLLRNHARALGNACVTVSLLYTFGSSPEIYIRAAVAQPVR